MQNDDNECFKWSIVLALNPVKDNPQRITKELQKQAERYEWSKVPSPTPYGDRSVNKFEKKNRISINVYGLRWEYNRERERMELLIFPLRLAEIDADGLKEVNLFYVTKEIKGFKIVAHYCVITSLSKLLSSTVWKDNNGKAYICCNIFKFQKDLDQHIPCMSSTFDRYPEPETILRFKNLKNVTKVPLTFIFDFESFLEPINEEELGSTNTSYSGTYTFCICISIVPDYQPEPIVRVKTKPDENMVKECLDTITSWVHKIHKKFENPRELNMTAKEKYIYEESNNCWICKKKFYKKAPWKEWKVREHDHFTGKFRGAPHNICNLRIQNRKVIPVIAHDLCKYGLKLFIRDLMKYTDSDPNVIAKSSEEFITVQ